MTKNSQETLSEILKETSATELAEVSGVKEGKVEAEESQESLPETEITISQDKLNDLLVDKEDLEIENKKLQQRQFANQIQEASDLHEIRKEYTNKLFFLTLSWLFVVGMFVFLTGMKLWRFNDPSCKENCFGFSLPENVLIAFITSTTATVIGIFIIVARWMFPSKEQKEESEKKSK
jgi:hypothetical protein